MTDMDVTLRDAFDVFAQLVDEAEPMLTDLDERSGDGDFGANLQGGLTQASTRATHADGATAWANLADVFLDDVGGTSGPLLGLLFQNLHRAAAGADEVDAFVRRGAAEGLAAIQRVGEAQPGDRTLVDALHPAVSAMSSGGGIAAAIDAAVDGAIATRDLVARRGRASYVGKRALGYPDPGAVGIALLFIAIGRGAGVPADDAMERLQRAAQQPTVAGDEVEASLADDVESALAAAARAQNVLAGRSLEDRADMLDTVAAALERNADELVEIAVAETHLSAARLSGEVVRSSFQLRLFADLVRSGGFLDVRKDDADDNWPAAPRPDLRRSNRPIGPVLVFAASNFPFAFSVLGGDTASALAAGNSVIVKAHPGHPRLSRRTAQVAQEAILSAGAPDGTLTLIEGDEQGVAALKDPRVKAAAFTGSIAGGRALFTIAQSRPDPIPFFGELGSNNPVFVTESADADGADEIADGFVSSFTLGAGQFCTKPGTLFVPTGSAVVSALRERELPAPADLLNDRILSGFHGRLREMQEAPNVDTLRADGDPYADPPAPVLLHAQGGDVLRDPDLYLGECFGPAALVVEYESSEQMMQLARAFGGQLTATVFGTDAESPDDLVGALVDRAGRVLWRQWPTGVSVTDAQQHGGPYPASTAPQTTSVGTAAIARFLRPVAMQGFPSRLLPRELRDE